MLTGWGRSSPFRTLSLVNVTCGYHTFQVYVAAALLQHVTLLDLRGMQAHKSRSFRLWMIFLWMDLGPRTDTDQIILIIQLMCLKPINFDR